MRASQRRSASSTIERISCSVVLSSAVNTSSWMPQPKFGRITRSPGAVSRMIRIDWRMSSSYCDARDEAGARIELDRHRPAAAEEVLALGSRGRRRSSDHHRGRAERDRVGRARLDDHVALPRGRQAADHHRHAADRDDAADVRLRPVGRAGTRACRQRRATPAARRSARSGSPVPGRAACRGSCVSPTRAAGCPIGIPQLMFTSEPRTVSVALALSSSVPVASMRDRSRP